MAAGLQMGGEGHSSSMAGVHWLTHGMAGMAANAPSGISTEGAGQQSVMRNCFSLSHYRRDAKALSEHVDMGTSLSV